MKNEGLHTHRFQDNPEELSFAWAWEGVHKASTPEDHVIDVTNDSERQLAATIIQWLGSPVGQTFLSDIGYHKHSPLKAPPELLDAEEEERLFIEAWQVINAPLGVAGTRILNYLIRRDNRPVEPTKDQYNLALKVIRWLGSYDGQDFLSDLGYWKDPS